MSSRIKLLAAFPPVIFLGQDWLDKSPLGRTLRFYSVAVPAWVHYKFVDRVYDEKNRSEAFAILHDRYSPIMEAQVLQMRGFFLKAAQLMSIREDYLPPQYLKWTRKMQNEAPVSFSSSEAQRIVCAELGLSDIADLFTDWHDQPVGSASIGQVYKARLKSRFVAVKVQAPYAETQFRADLAACKFFCRFALPHLVGSLEEIERQFLTEFDYQAEARNLAQVREGLLPAWAEKIEVPAPHQNLCTRKVLVMDFIEGPKLSDVFEEYLKKLAKSTSSSMEEVREKLKSEILNQGLTRRAGGIFRSLKDKLVLLIQPTTPITLLATAMEVHGHQVFRNRTFNGDPHPGNLLLTPSGKLGLVDFGQVKRLSKERTAQIARLVLALHAEDKTGVCAIVKEMGCQNLRDDPDTVWRLTAFWMDRDTPDVTLGMDIHKFLEEMERRDPQQKLCQDLVMVGRCSVMLRSLGLCLGLRVRTTDYWASFAKEYLDNYCGAEDNLEN